MPWQRQVADVALEVLPGGGWAYRTVVVTVQRQAGKTTLTGPMNLQTALTVRNARTWLTAQRRQDARDTWLELVQRVRQSPLAGLCEVRESNGGESLTTPLGGTYRPFAPSEDALHGTTNQRVTVDEGWAFNYLQGIGLEQAILPTFTTTGGQLALVSTAGTAESVWLRSYVDRGRAAVEQGRTEGLAYFEWSLAEEHADTVTAALDGDDPAAFAHAVDLVMAAHPANGYTLRRTALEDAADLLRRRPAEFLRAYGNVWTTTAETVIPAHLWAAGRAEIPRPEPGQLALGFDVALDRSDAAIGAAWRDGDRICVDVIAHAPGAAWLAERLPELAASWRAAIGHDKNGPALAVAEELARLAHGPQLVGTGTREHATACATILGAVLDGRLAHPGAPALDAAVGVAATRTLGDGFAWSRRNSAASIAPLGAVTAALHALDHGPQAMPAPLIYVRKR